MEDSDIIKMYEARDERAISETADKYASYCYSISYNILRSKEDAEECVNDTFVKAWSIIPPKKPNCMKAFLGRITRNISLNVLEKSSAQKRGAGEYELALSELDNILCESSNVEDEIIKKEIISAVNHFLGTISKEKRIIFVRRYWYLDSVADISKKCGISESKVKSVLFRTRRSLREYLKKEVSIYE